MMLPSLAPEASASADFATAAYKLFNEKPQSGVEKLEMVPRTGIEPVRLSPIPGF